MPAANGTEETMKEEDSKQQTGEFEVVVYRLSATITVDELKNHFKSAGNVASVVIFREPVKENKLHCIAFIDFPEKESFNAALKMDQSLLDGQPIMVLPAARIHEDLMIMRRGANITVKKDKDNEVKGEKDQLKDNEKDGYIPVYKKSEFVAYVKNIPNECSDEDILNFFEMKKEDIVDMIVLYRQNNYSLKGKGKVKRSVKAIIAFKTAKDLEEALAKSKNILNDQEIIVDKYVLNARPEKRIAEDVQSGEPAEKHAKPSEDKPRDVVEQQIRNFCASAGAMNHQAGVFTDNFSGANKGMGFITMKNSAYSDEDSVQKCQSMGNSQVFTPGNNNTITATDCWSESPSDSAKWAKQQQEPNAFGGPNVSRKDNFWKGAPDGPRPFEQGGLGGLMHDDSSSGPFGMPQDRGFQGNSMFRDLEDFPSAPVCSEAKLSSEQLKTDAGTAMDSGYGGQIPPKKEENFRAGDTYKEFTGPVHVENERRPEDRRDLNNSVSIWSSHDFQDYPEFASRCTDGEGFSGDRMSTHSPVPSENDENDAEKSVEIPLTGDALDESIPTIVNVFSMGVDKYSQESDKSSVSEDSDAPGLMIDSDNHSLDGADDAALPTIGSTLSASIEDNSQNALDVTLRVDDGSASCVNEEGEALNTQEPSADMLDPSLPQIGNVFSINSEEAARLGIVEEDSDSVKEIGEFPRIIRDSADDPIDLTVYDDDQDPLYIDEGEYDKRYSCEELDGRSEFIGDEEIDKNQWKTSANADTLHQDENTIKKTNLQINNNPNCNKSLNTNLESNAVRGSQGGYESKHPDLKSNLQHDCGRNDKCSNSTFNCNLLLDINDPLGCNDENNNDDDAKDVVIICSEPSTLPDRSNEGNKTITSTLGSDNRSKPLPPSMEQDLSVSAEIQSGGGDAVSVYKVVSGMSGGTVVAKERSRQCNSDSCSKDEQKDGDNIASSTQISLKKSATRSVIKEPTRNLKSTASEAGKQPLFVCNMCNRSYKRERMFINHVSTHKQYTSLFDCDICGHVFQNQGLLDKHLCNPRTGKDSDKNAKSEEKQKTSAEEAAHSIMQKYKFFSAVRNEFVCDTCDQGFQYFSLLETHLHNHKTGRYPLVGGGTAADMYGKKEKGTESEVVDLPDGSNSAILPDDKTLKDTESTKEMVVESYAPEMPPLQNISSIQTMLQSPTVPPVVEGVSKQVLVWTTDRKQLKVVVVPEQMKAPEAKKRKRCLQKKDKKQKVQKKKKLLESQQSKNHTRTRKLDGNTYARISQRILPKPPPSTFVFKDQLAMTKKPIMVPIIATSTYDDGLVISHEGNTPLLPIIADPPLSNHANQLLMPIAQFRTVLPLPVPSNIAQTAATSSKTPMPACIVQSKPVPLVEKQVSSRNPVWHNEPEKLKLKETDQLTEENNLEDHAILPDDKTLKDTESTKEMVVESYAPEMPPLQNISLIQTMLQSPTVLPVVEGVSKQTIGKFSSKDKKLTITSTSPILKKILTSELCVPKHIQAVHKTTMDPKVHLVARSKEPVASRQQLTAHQYLNIHTQEEISKGSETFGVGSSGGRAALKQQRSNSGSYGGGGFPDSFASAGIDQYQTAKKSTVTRSRLLDSAQDSFSRETVESRSFHELGQEDFRSYSQSGFDGGSNSDVRRQSDQDLKCSLMHHPEQGSSGYTEEKSGFGSGFGASSGSCGFLESTGEGGDLPQFSSSASSSNTAQGDFEASALDLTLPKVAHVP